MREVHSNWSAHQLTIANSFSFCCNIDQSANRCSYSNWQFNWTQFCHNRAYQTANGTRCSRSSSNLECTVATLMAIESMMMTIWFVRYGSAISHQTHAFSFIIFNLLATFDNWFHRRVVCVFDFMCDCIHMWACRHDAHSYEHSEWPFFTSLVIWLI